MSSYDQMTVNPCCQYCFHQRAWGASYMVWHDTHQEPPSSIALNMLGANEPCSSWDKSQPNPSAAPRPRHERRCIQSISSFPQLQQLRMIHRILSISQWKDTDALQAIWSGLQVSTKHWANSEVKDIRRAPWNFPKAYNGRHWSEVSLKYQPKVGWRLD